MLHRTEHIDPRLILTEIKPKNRRYLTKLEIFDTIASTNTYLLQQTTVNTPSGWLCLSDQQQQGRGRTGKTWVSPAGANIYCSLFWRFRQSQHNLSGLSLAIAVMIVNALRQYGITEGIQLKWPNDILFLGKKLGGILLESNAANNIVIGIGLNLYLPAEEQAILTNAISIHDIVPGSLQRNRLIGLVVNELLHQLPVFEKKGLAAFIQEWRQLDALNNKKIIIHAAHDKIAGIMCGINEQGALLLRNEVGNQQVFCYGEVSVTT